MGSKFGDDDTRTVLSGGRSAKPSKRRLTPPSDSVAQPKYTRKNTLVGEANRKGSSDFANEILSDTGAGKQHNDLDQMISGSEVAEEEVVCFDSLGITEEEDCLEDDVCVQCGKGGNLLVCSDVSCPISVHEKCMNCPALFDRSGHFYCPVCSCKKAEKKLALARGYLSRFMAKNGALKDRSLKRVRMEKPNPATPKDGLDCDGIDDQNVQIKKDREEERYKKAARTDNVPCLSADHARPDEGNQNRAETVQQIHEESLIGAEDGLDCDETGNENVQFRKDQQENRDKDCCTTSLGVEESEIAARTVEESGDGTETSQKIHQEALVDADYGLDCDKNRNQNVQIKKGQQEGRDKNCCITSISPRTSAKASHIAAITDSVPSKSADLARPDDGHQHRAETIQQIHEETLIACGSADQGPSREKAGQSCKDLHDGQTVLEENPTIVIDDGQKESMFQNEQQIGHARSDDEPLIVTESEMENRKTVMEREEGVQAQDKGSSRLFKGGGSMQQDQERCNDFNQRHQDVQRAPTLDSPRQKTTNLISEEAKIAARSSVGTCGTTCKKRRRKLAWTAEEENKLKEGVQKFLCTVKKNVPWRKILDFGVGVFDSSRTPDDLKDKWRTMNGKRSSG